MSTQTTFDRFASVLERCTHPFLQLEIGQDGSEEQPVYWLRVGNPNGFCTRTGEPMDWVGRKWRLSQWMTDTELVWTAWKAILTALEHEAREMFRFDGVTVADSHVDIHKLVSFMKAPENHEERAHG